MSILNKYYSNEIVEPLFETSILSKFDNVTDWLHYNTVYIPTYNNQISVISDTDVTQDTTTVGTTETALEFRTEAYHIETPIHVVNFESYQSSYNKLNTVLKNTVAQFKEQIEHKIIQKLVDDATSGVAATIIETTGSNGVANGSDFVTAKKKVTLQDLIKLAQTFASQKIRGEKYLVLDPTMYFELISDDNIIKHSNFNGEVSKTGEIMKVLGINILMKETLPNDGIDARYGFAFVSNSIAIAHQPIKHFTNTGDAFKRGDIIQLEMGIGSKIVSKDKAGVILLKQG